MYYLHQTQPRQYYLRFLFGDEQTGEAYYATQPRRERYGLIAVVQMRNLETGRDFVRTYGTDGAHIVTEVEPKSFMSRNWSIEQPQRHSYMLFPSWCGDTELYPGVLETLRRMHIGTEQEDDLMDSLARYQTQPPRAPASPADIGTQNVQAGSELDHPVSPLSGETRGHHGRQMDQSLRTPGVWMSLLLQPFGVAT